MRHPFSRALLLSAAASIALASTPVTASKLPPDQAREIFLHEQSRNLEDGVLVELAGHRNASVRARAYRGLGRLQVVNLLPDLTKGLKDKDETVRFEAAFAIAQMFDPAAEPVLLEWLDKEKSVAIRERMIEGLGKCGTETSIKTLISHMEGQEPTLAHSAAAALGAMGNRGVDMSSSGEGLRKALRSTDPELRWRAAFAVLRGKVRSSTSGLMGSLRRKDANTLIYSCRAVGAVGVRKMGTRLIPLFSHEDWRVRLESLKALGAIRSDFHVSQASLLLEDPNEHVRLAAIETMGKLAGGGGLGRTDFLEETNDWRTRGALVKAKALGRGDGALLDVKICMKDPDWRIRLAAVEALALVKSEHALLLMESMVNDDSPQVATAVVSGLSLFPQRHAVELLRPFLQSGDPAILTSAATAAGERYDLKAIRSLVTAYDKLQSPVDTEVMTAVLGAIGAILTATEDDDPIGELTDGDRALGAALLESALHDTDINVAAAAAQSLSMIRGELVEPAKKPTPRLPEMLDVDLAMELMSHGGPVTARIVTNKGDVIIRLVSDEAPGTVSNFVRLAQNGYYSGLDFHRVVSDFVIQGGDPRGDGWGGPGYAIRCEINPLRYGRGMVGMALAGKDTGGSQFFITHSPQPHLDGRYTIFGQVIEGMDVVDRIQVGDRIDEIQIEGL